MRLLPLLFLACLTASVPAEETGHEPPFLAYEWSGAFSTYDKVAVEIQLSGATEVRLEKQKKPPAFYRTDLSKEEMGALKTLIASTEFFAQQNQDSTRTTDTGTTKITIVGEKETKVLRFLDLDALDPLCQFVGKLVTQANALLSIAADDDIYSAVGTVNPLFAGSKALQPERFRAPLFSYVDTATHSQKLRWALESLAWITTPEAYVGLISNQIENPKRRNLILLAFPGSGNLPEKHGKALCPLYLDFVRKNHLRVNERTTEENSAYEGFVSALGDARYAPSIPLFTKWLEEWDQTGITPDIIPLSKMGMPGLEALIPFLDSPKENQRCNAMELLTIASRGNPRSKYSNPFSDSQYAEMIPVFEKTILPKLVVISEADPSEKARMSAASAIPEIREEIKK